MAAPETHPNALITIPKAAKLIGVSRTTLYRLIDAGALPVVEWPGAFRRIRVCDLDAFIEAHTSVREVG